MKTFALIDERAAHESTQDRERRRLTTLRSYGILDTPREPEFDDIAAMAAQACGTPIAYIGFLDDRRQWFKAEIGYGVRELPHPPSICSDAIRSEDMLYLPDLAADPDYADSIFLSEPFGIRFYAGVPLKTPDGLAIGTVCVLDRVPRELNAQQLSILRALARTVMAQLDMRKAIAAQARAEARMLESEDHYRHTVELNPQVPWTCDPQGNITSYSQRWLDLTGQKPGEPDGSGWAKALHPDDLDPTIEHFSARLASGDPVDVDYRILVAKSGMYRWMRARAQPRRNADGQIIRWYGVVEDVHDRKVAEADLRVAMKAGRFGAWTLELATGELTASETCRTNFGRAPNAPFSYADLRDAVHPGDRARMAEAVERSIATREDYDIEYRIVTPEGETRWVHVRGQPTFSSDGLALSMSGVSIDITRRRQDEAELNVVSERLRLATENAEIGFWDVDVVNDVLIWPPRVKAMFGISPDVPVTMQDFYDGLHPDDRDATSRAYLAAADTAQRALYDVEYRTIGKEDGVVRWVAAKGRGLFVEDRCVRVVGTAIDITERKAAEARFRELADNMSQFAWTADASGSIFWYNKRWYDYTGTTLEEMRGWGWRKVHHPDHVARVVEKISQCFETGQYWEDTFPLRASSGEYRWFLSRALPIRDEAGNVVRWFGTNTDVTEQLEAEDSLRELNETLERRVEEEVTERTKAEEALRQSQKMEAVGQLTGGLAHDFNNLLTGISGSLSLLQSRVSQGRLTEIDGFVAAAQGAAKRASALTHRLLAFSRRQTLDPKPTDINALVNGMEDLIRRTIGPSIALEIVGAGGLWVTMVDPPQLENALLNLCINARDAMPNGGRITIETANKWLDPRAARERDLSPGQYLSLCVTDNGTGMSPDVIDKAFDPFFTTKPIGQGTGLGLSMIYGFVRQSGGQARIYSELGRGTTMCLYLPRHIGAAEMPDLSADLIAPQHEAHDKTVLVVDDEPTVRMLVTEVLKDLGYAALQAADAPSGLKVLLSDARIDLLVSDVGLPGGMNGRQMADAARAQRPDLKVLFITGYAENAVVGNGHLEPGMHVITKPFDIDVFSMRIQDLLAG